MSLRRNLLRRITVIGGERVEHLLVPDPVLQHLRRRLDEIAGTLVPEKRAYFARGHDRVERVAELVEERLDVADESGAMACLGWAAGSCRGARRSGR